jgi:hypothetical protein
MVIAVLYDANDMLVPVFDVAKTLKYAGAGNSFSYLHGKK